MSQTTTMTQLQRELHINRDIDQAMNQLLPQMKAFMDDTQIWKSDMELNQLQNLLSTAQDTQSVEVVKNFIYYQMGRDNRGSSWRKSERNQPSFGDRLIQALDELRDTAVLITEAYGGQTGDIDKAWMNLTRLYLGNLRRYFYYHKRTGSGGR
ncbi:MAG: hypothetical protein H6657_02500 [Ardenticatenaceae bacterium]|nr:hypothetical protein [Anaerolineales bacterium]MCB8976277.1 hypothetical protein [Ardenticatenaceae bacterium]